MDPVLNELTIIDTQHLENESVLLVHYTLSDTGAWVYNLCHCGYRGVCEDSWIIMIPNHQHPRHTDARDGQQLYHNGGTINGTFAWNYGGIQGVESANFDADHSYLVQLTMQKECGGVEPSGTGSTTGSVGITIIEELTGRLPFIDFDPPRIPPPGPGGGPGIPGNPGTPRPAPDPLPRQPADPVHPDDPGGIPPHPGDPRPDPPGDGYPSGSIPLDPPGGEDGWPRMPDPQIGPAPEPPRGSVPGIRYPGLVQPLPGGRDLDPPPGNITTGDITQNEAPGFRPIEDLNIQPGSDDIIDVTLGEPLIDLRPIDGVTIRPPIDFNDIIRLPLDNEVSRDISPLGPVDFSDYDGTIPRVSTRLPVEPYQPIGERTLSPTRGTVYGRIDLNAEDTHPTLGNVGDRQFGDIPVIPGRPDVVEPGQPLGETIIVVSPTTAVQGNRVVISTLFTPYDVSSIYPVTAEVIGVDVLGQPYVLGTLDETFTSVAAPAGLALDIRTDIFAVGTVALTVVYKDRNDLAIGTASQDITVIQQQDDPPGVTLQPYDTNNLGNISADIQNLTRVTLEPMDIIVEPTGSRDLILTPSDPSVSDIDVGVVVRETLTLQPEIPGGLRVGVFDLSGASDTTLIGAQLDTTGGITITTPGNPIVAPTEFSIVDGQPVDLGGPIAIEPINTNSTGVVLRIEPWGGQVSDINTDVYLHQDIELRPVIRTSGSRDLDLGTVDLQFNVPYSSEPIRILVLGYEENSLPDTVEWNVADANVSGSVTFTQISAVPEQYVGLYSYPYRLENDRFHVERVDI